MKNILIECVGYTIAADWYEGTDKNQILLVLPGWSSTKKKQELLTAHIVKNTGSAALVIDYSGHGDSPFDKLNVTPAQHFLEVINAYDWITNNHPNANINVLGNSYGGYLAAILSTYRPIGSLVLRVPAIYLHEQFYTLNRNIDRQHERRYREDESMLDTHQLFKEAKKHNGRTLVVRHEQDEFVPKQTTDKYIDSYAADSYVANGWKHRFNSEASKSEQLEYQNYISDWLKA